VCVHALLLAKEIITQYTCKWMDAILTRTHHWSFREKKQKLVIYRYIFASVIRSKGLRLTAHEYSISLSFYEYIIKKLTVQHQVCVFMLCYQPKKNFLNIYVNGSMDAILTRTHHWSFRKKNRNL
jgi:hypothetical protein